MVTPTRLRLASRATYRTDWAPAGAEAISARSASSVTRRAPGEREPRARMPRSVCVVRVADAERPVEVRGRVAARPHRPVAGERLAPAQAAHQVGVPDHEVAERAARRERRVELHAHGVR